MSIRLSSAYSMGKYERKAQFVNDRRYKDVPGPDRYSLVSPDRTSKTNRQPAWSQSKSSRFENFNTKTPGPGSYELNLAHKRGPCWSARGRRYVDSELVAHGITSQPFKMNSKPGPGFYEGSHNLSASISYTMQGPTDKVVNGTEGSWLNPGPGHYDGPDQRYYKYLKGTKMSQTEARKSFFLKTTVSGNPDAGKYNIPGSFNAQPKFSFGKSVRDEPLPRGPPGPGAYNYIN